MAKKRRPAAHSPWISRDAVTKDLPILDKPPAKREKKAVDLEFRRRIIHARLMAFLLPYAKDKAIEEAAGRVGLALRASQAASPAEL
jgi:hypothetical protein